MRKKRGLSSEDARKVRAKGHKDALFFAELIGLESDYQNDLKAKKDVVDGQGDSHSLKSGEKKWQIFLYSKNRFEEDYGWSGMNGIGDTMVECIEAFPEDFDDYQSNKKECKKKLETPMVELAEKLSDEKNRKNFFSKSLFNGGEVDYLTIKEGDQYHVFYNRDVVDTFSENLNIENSKARNSGQCDNQKVVFKYENKNLCEIEMRNDSKVHYREVRFNMLKKPALNLLKSEVELKKEECDGKILIYGKAAKKFKIDK